MPVMTPISVTYTPKQKDGKPFKDEQGQPLRFTHALERPLATTPADFVDLAGSASRAVEIYNAGITAEVYKPEVSAVLIPKVDQALGIESARSLAVPKTLDDLDAYAKKIANRK